MRSEKISNLKTGDRIELQNEPFLQNLLEPDDLLRLKKKIENGDLIGVDSWYDTSYLNGTIYLLPGQTIVELDLLPKEGFNLDMNRGYLVELLQPGDDGYEKPKSPTTQTTQVVKGAKVDMRPFDRNVDGVGTRIAINPNALRNLRGDGIEIMLLGTVLTLEEDSKSYVGFDKGQAFQDERYVYEKHYIIFNSDEDAKKVRPFNSDRDDVGSRVAVSGMNMPDGNDVTKMYYGTIKIVGVSYVYIGIEFDSKIVGGNSLGGLADNDSGLEVINYEVFILDEPIASKGNKSYVLEMITDVILSTTSRTTTNRAELIKALIEDKVTEDEVRQSFDSQEAYDLFKDILQDLEKDEAKRLGTTASTITTTPTTAPIVKRPRKKKEPALPEPTQIPTPDTSVFKDEDELSSLLDEFLT